MKFLDCTRLYQEKELPPAPPHPPCQPSSIPHASDVIHNFLAMSLSKITSIILFSVCFFLSQKFDAILQASVCKPEGLLSVCNHGCVEHNSYSSVKTSLILIYSHMCIMVTWLMSIKNFHKFFD